MRKLIVVAFEAEVGETTKTNAQLIESVSNGDWLYDQFEEAVLNSNFDVLAVFNTESEKADADSTGETNGPTGLYEVPC